MQHNVSINHSINVMMNAVTRGVWKFLTGSPFKTNCHTIAMMKAIGIMAVIRSFDCIDFKCFNLLCKSLVRPHLEYGLTVWFRINHHQLLEQIFAENRQPTAISSETGSGNMTETAQMNSQPSTSYSTPYTLWGLSWLLLTVCTWQLKH